jgi:hypothetical protein
MAATTQMEGSLVTGKIRSRCTVNLNHNIGAKPQQQKD